MYEAKVAGDGRARRSLRELVDSGDPTLGGWCAIPSAFSAEVLACAGYDWVCIDAQHGLIGYDQMAAMLQGLDARGVATMVRAEWNMPSAIMKALDAGAQGVIVPMINSATEAEAAARSCRYPPLGFRSWGPVRAALGNPAYGPESANRTIVCVVMVETPQGVEAVEEIVAVPGVDGVLIGPYDLSLTTNLNVETPGDKPRDIEQIARVLAACDAVGIPCGITCQTGADVRRRRAEGFRLLQLNWDVGLLSQAATALVADARRNTTRDVGEGHE
jgi:4-hydroxy-2-oxoheptanedioate aldolase